MSTENVGAERVCPPNVDEQREAARAPREDWYQRVLANSADLISTHTPDMDFVFASAAGGRLLGYQPEELVGRSLFELMHPDDVAQARRTYDGLLLDPAQPEAMTYRFRCQDGSYLWTQTALRVMGESLAEEREHWVAVTRDVSDYKQGEERQVRLQRALERAAFEWRTTFDAIQSPLLLVGLDGRVQRLNRATRDLLGRDYREILGRPVEAVGKGQPWATVVALAHRVLASFEPEVCEAADGERQRTWEVEASVSGTSEEGEAKVIVQVRDITKTARLQESLRRSETMAALGAVVGGVAHEVRNPLFGMSAVLDAFESRFGDRPEHRPYLPMLRTELGRMAELMQALLEYGKPAQFELNPGYISEAVDNALELCRPLAEAQGLSLVLRSEAEGHPVLFDVQRLTQALKNVVENAIQHSPAGGEVIVTAARLTPADESWVRVSVRDHGTGFAPEDLPRVLEPFFSRRSGGTGLGLSIVSRVIEGHGGRLRLANHPEGGSVVDLELPCVQPAEH